MDGYGIDKCGWQVENKWFTPFIHSNTKASADGGETLTRNPNDVHYVNGIS